MALSNIICPNNYNIYARSFTTPKLLFTDDTFKNNEDRPQTALNYYEEYNGEAKWSGAFEKTIPGGLSITRIGRIVNCKIKFLVEKSTRESKIYISIPNRFLPRADVVYKILICDDNNYADGILIVSIKDYVIISPGINPNNNFKNNTKIGLFNDIEISWQYGIADNLSPKIDLIMSNLSEEKKELEKKEMGIVKINNPSNNKIIIGSTIIKIKTTTMGNVQT